MKGTPEVTDLLGGSADRRELCTVSMAGGSEKNLKAVPGNHTDVDPATKDFVFQQVRRSIKQCCTNGFLILMCLQSPV